MAGIYIHIPFCKQKCNYCNFFSLATTKSRDDFFQALLREIELTRDYLGDEPVETIYFGGGTPSLLSVSQLEEILNKIRDAGYAMRDTPYAIRDEEYGILGSQIADHKSLEITLEMNPDDVTPEYLEMLSQSAINRISLGVQSFFDEDLNYLSRSHDAKQAEIAVKLIWDAGYGMRDMGCAMPDKQRETRNAECETVSVDLIYGIPTLTNEHWKENLQRVIDFGIPHISAYALTVEPKTPLAWKIEKAQGAGRRAESAGRRAESSGRRAQSSGVRAESSEPVSDYQASEQFEILMDTMEQHGYIQYEISNFCLPGYESKHNSNYWRGIPYIGLGPSAHSFNGTSRRWNIPNLTEYIQGIQSYNLHFEEEILTLTQRYNEYVMTSLRTIRGCDICQIKSLYGEDYERNFVNQAIWHQTSGYLTEQSSIYTLTRKGKFLADGIAAELFVE